MNGVSIAFAVAFGVALSPFVYAALVAMLAMGLWAAHWVIQTLRGTRWG